MNSMSRRTGSHGRQIRLVTTTAIKDVEISSVVSVSLELSLVMEMFRRKSRACLTARTKNTVIIASMSHGMRYIIT